MFRSTVTSLCLVVVLAASGTSQQELEQVGDAYWQLHQAALGALQAEMEGWQAPDSAGTSRSSGTDLPVRKGVDVMPPESLVGEQLLIAACSEGLLAGAPNGSSASRGDSSTDVTSDDEALRRRVSTSTGMPVTHEPSEQTVGMLLVAAHSKGAPARGVDFQKQTGQQQTERMGNSSPAASGVIVGRLLPGVYCVKRAGPSVWLTDQGGEIVLRATIESAQDPLLGTAMKPGVGTAGAGTAGAGTDENPAERPPRENGSSATRPDAGASTAQRGHADDWELIFGAITKEAMSSLGWNQHPVASSAR